MPEPDHTDIHRDNAWQDLLLNLKREKTIRRYRRIFTITTSIAAVLLMALFLFRTDPVIEIETESIAGNRLERIQPQQVDLPRLQTIRSDFTQIYTDTSFKPALITDDELMSLLQDNPLVLIDQQPGKPEVILPNSM